MPLDALCRRAGRPRARLLPLMRLDTRTDLDNLIYDRQLLSDAVDPVTGPHTQRPSFETAEDRNKTMVTV